MKPSEIGTAIELCIDAGLNAFIWGEPGGGKTAVTNQVAVKRGIECRALHISQLDPVDLRGIPYVINGRTKWAVPDFLPVEPGNGGILFFDEYAQGAHGVMNASSQLLLERRIGDYTLPAGWSCVAASNNAKDRAATNKLPTHITSRYIHLNFETDLDEWTAYARAKDFAFEVRSFLRLHSEYLHKFDPKVDQKSYPCPRTWEFVSRIFNAKPAEAIETALYSGAVGEGAAAAFLGFLRVYKNLPSIDGIIADPDNGPIPGADKPEVMYAICGTLARRVGADPRVWPNVSRYVARLSKEFGVCLVTEASRRCPDIQNTKEFINWSVKNADVKI